jgi:transposase
MIRPDTRKAIQTLHEAGKPKKEIARLLALDPKTVRSILSGKGEHAFKQRSDKIPVEEDLIRKLHHECHGYAQRIWEILTEEHHIVVGYSTLTRLIRELGLDEERNERAGRVPDEPGAEMQHDTSPYTLTIGDKQVKVIASGLYLRYSKMRYVKFYLTFNRFKMKCFFHEALSFWGYSATRCIIDNTNLSVLHGTGKDAVFNPEMVSFADRYGFHWLAHALGHSNRKAGTERNFWTIETNFFPGRSFKSIGDLNIQAFDWATVRYAKRPVRPTRLIPMEVFSEEKSSLIALPPYIEPPYEPHKRDIDQYGYIPFNGNHYWIPGKSIYKELQVIEYPEKIQIFENPHTLLIEYPLPHEGTRGQIFKPPGTSPPHEPRNRKKPSREEEKRLRALSEVCSQYLDFILSTESGVRYKHEFIRSLYGLSKQIAPSLFLKTLERALSYKVTSLETLERISSRLMKQDRSGDSSSSQGHDASYTNRPAYHEGQFSEETGLSDLRRSTEPDEEEKPQEKSTREGDGRDG